MMKGHCSFHFTIFKTLRTTRQNKQKSYGRAIPYLFNIGKGKQGQKYLVVYRCEDHQTKTRTYVNMTQEKKNIVHIKQTTACSNCSILLYGSECNITENTQRKTHSKHTQISFVKWFLPLVWCDSFHLSCDSVVLFLLRSPLDRE